MKTPTQKQAKAIKNVVENGGNVSKAMRDAGYSPETAKTPKKLTDSKAWEQLMEKNLPDKTLAKVHKQLLSSTSIEHMVFPTTTTNKEISDLLRSVNCRVRKFQRGNSATHVWFWSANDKSRKEALDMAYKLKGRYKDKPLVNIETHSHLTIEKKGEIVENIREAFASGLFSK